MKTISFKIKYDDKTRQLIDEDSRICSAMRRFVYNRLKDEISKVEINSLLK